jgi:hypothetical protein
VRADGAGALGMEGNKILTKYMLENLKEGIAWKNYV